MHPRFVHRSAAVTRIINMREIHLRYTLDRIYRTLIGRGVHRVCRMVSLEISSHDEKRPRAVLSGRRCAPAGRRGVRVWKLQEWNVLGYSFQQPGQCRLRNPLVSRASNDKYMGLGNIHSTTSRHSVISPLPAALSAATAMSTTLLTTPDSAATPSVSLLVSYQDCFGLANIHYDIPV